jgi:hypothetical protein
MIHRVLRYYIQVHQTIIHAPILSFVPIINSVAVPANQDSFVLLFGENYPHLHYMISGFDSIVCAYNYSSSSAKSTFEAIALASNSTIFYPHSGPDVLISQLVLIPLVLTGVYVIVVIVVFRRGAK